MNQEVKRKRRHILMFLDNASSHGDFQLSNATLKFLTANTTSHLQPLDQGIIRTFKARYKKHLLRSLLSKIERAESVSELSKEIILLDAINWTAKAWSETAPSTLTKCFKTTGFPVTDEQEDDYEDEDDIPLSLLVQQLRVDHWKTLTLNHQQKKALGLGKRPNIKLC